MEHGAVSKSYSPIDTVCIQTKKTTTETKQIEVPKCEDTTRGGKLFTSNQKQFPSLSVINEKKSK